MLGHVLDDSDHISYCDDSCKFMKVVIMKDCVLL